MGTRRFVNFTHGNNIHWTLDQNTFIFIREKEFESLSDLNVLIIYILCEEKMFPPDDLGSRPEALC